MLNGVSSALVILTNLSFCIAAVEDTKGNGRENASKVQKQSCGHHLRNCMATSYACWNKSQKCQEIMPEQKVAECTGSQKLSVLRHVSSSSQH